MCWAPGVAHPKSTYNFHFTIGLPKLAIGRVFTGRTSHTKVAQNTVVHSELYLPVRKDRPIANEHRPTGNWTPSPQSQWQRDDQIFLLIHAHIPPNERKLEITSSRDNAVAK